MGNCSLAQSLRWYYFLPWDHLVTAKVWAVSLNPYCLNSPDLWKLSRVLERLRGDAQSCYSAGPLLKDSCENWLQSSVTERVRTVSGLFSFFFKLAAYSGLECWPDFTWFGGGLGTRIRSLWYLSQKRVIIQRNLKGNYSFFYIYKIFLWS